VYPGSEKTGIAANAAPLAVTRNCLRKEWLELSDKNISVLKLFRGFEVLDVEEIVVRFSARVKKLFCSSEHAAPLKPTQPSVR
jgi:hypothetical protein